VLTALYGQKAISSFLSSDWSQQDPAAIQTEQGIKRVWVRTVSQDGVSFTNSCRIGLDPSGADDEDSKCIV
jgi:hypothetical protein